MRYKLMPLIALFSLLSHRCAAQASGDVLRISKDLVFAESSTPVKTTSTLYNAFQTQPIVVLVPINDDLAKLVRDMFLEFGYQRVMVIQLPQNPSDKICDSVKAICNAKGIQLIAQAMTVNFKASLGKVNFGEVQSPCNIAITFTEWNAVKGKYNSASATIVATSIPAAKKKFRKLFKLD
jgi:hypothetical protein